MKRDYYRKAAYLWWNDYWVPVQGVIIKCLTEEEAKAKLECSGERWEKIEILEENKDGT